MFKMHATVEEIYAQTEGMVIVVRNFENFSKSNIFIDKELAKKVYIGQHVTVEINDLDWID